MEKEIINAIWLCIAKNQKVLLENIYKEVCLNKINVINIEYQQFNNLSNENYREIVYIFDKDNCEI